MKKLWGCILVFAVLLTGCRSASVLSFDVWRPAKSHFSGGYRAGNCR